MNYHPVASQIGVGAADRERSVIAPSGQAAGARHPLVDPEVADTLKLLKVAAEVLSLRSMSVSGPAWAQFKALPDLIAASQRLIDELGFGDESGLSRD